MSPGFSGKFLLGLVNFRRGSIDDAVIWYSPDVVLYCVGVNSLFVLGLVCCVVSVVMGGVKCDEVVWAIEN